MTDPTLMQMANAYAKRRASRNSKSSRPGEKAKFVKWFTDRTKELLRESPYVIGETKKIAKQIAAQAGQLEQKLNELKGIKDPSDMNVRDRIIALHDSMTADISQLKRALPNQFARPGAKAKMAKPTDALMAVIEKRKRQMLDDLHEAVRGPMQATTIKPLVSPIEQAQALIQKGDADGAIRLLNGWAQDIMSKYRVDPQMKHVAYAANALAKSAREAIEDMKQARFSRRGAKAKMGRAEDIYRKLNSGAVTVANAKEWERLAAEALRLPDFTPAGTDWSLHELAEEVGQEILALKSRASRPGAKAKFSAFVTGDKVTAKHSVQGMKAGTTYTVTDVHEQHTPFGTFVTYELDGKLQIGNGHMLLTKVRASRPGAKAKMGANEDRKRAAGYKWQVRYTKQLGKTDYLGGSPQVIEDTVYFATESAARDWANTMLGKGWFKGMGGSPEKVLTAKVLMFSRPGSKSTHAVDYPAMLRALENTMLEAKANGLEFLQSYKIARQVANSRVLRGRQATAGEILDARKRLEEDMAEEMGQSKHSRPNAKAEMARSREAILGEIKDATITLRETGGKEAEADLRKLQQLKAKAEASLSRDVMAKIEAELDGIMRDWGYFSRPGAKATHAALPPQTLEAERKPGGGSHSEAVSRKIATLINEGKPQDQAVAIALDLERRGEL